MTDVWQPPTVEESRDRAWERLRRDAAALVDGVDDPKLEVASGYNPAPGFIHVDLSTGAPDVDLVCSVRDLPWDDATFAEVRAVDILEHFSYRDTFQVLCEWVRVLRPGGRIYIQVPDAETMMGQYLQRPAAMVVDEFGAAPPIVSIAWRILGGHADGQYSRDGDDWRWNAHYALFSESSLRWYLEQAGLLVESIVRNPFPNLLAWARKP